MNQQASVGLWGCGCGLCLSFGFGSGFGLGFGGACWAQASAACVGQFVTVVSGCRLSLSWRLGRALLPGIGGDERAARSWENENSKEKRERKKNKRTRKKTRSLGAKPI